MDLPNDLDVMENCGFVHGLLDVCHRSFFSRNKSIDPCRIEFYRKQPRKILFWLYFIGSHQKDIQWNRPVKIQR